MVVKTGGWTRGSKPWVRQLWVSLGQSSIDSAQAPFHHTKAWVPMSDQSAPTMSHPAHREAPRNDCEEESTLDHTQNDNQYEGHEKKKLHIIGSLGLHGCCAHRARSAHSTIPNNHRQRILYLLRLKPQGQDRDPLPLDSHGPKTRRASAQASSPSLGNQATTGEYPERLALHVKHEAT
jgi:hypothetical protein